MKRLGGVLCLVLGCGEVVPPPAISPIDEFILGLSPLGAEADARNAGPLGPEQVSGDFSCATQDIQQTLRFEQLPGLAVNGALFPGEILRGDSIVTGGFTETVFDRKPATFSVSLSGLPNSAATMQNPSLSEFRTKLEGLLSAGGTIAAPAAIDFEIEEVNSQEQLNLAVGFNANVGPVSGAIDFDFNDQNKRSRALVKYIQTFYTVDLDQPSLPSDFFDDSVTLEEVEAKFNDGNPPVYVTSMTVGRIIYFSAESSFSSTELKAALEFAVNGTTDVSGNVSLTNQEILESSTVKAFVLGGDPEQASLAVVSGLDGVRALITEGAVFDPLTNPGAPIAYNLAHLADNSPAAISFTSNFQAIVCDRIAQKVRVTLDNIHCNQQSDVSGAAELFGLVTASSANVVTLLDRPQGQNITIDDNQTVNLGDFGIVEVDLRTTPSIELLVNFDEDDSPFGTDNFPTEIRDLTDNWRGTFQINIVAGSDQYVANFSLIPVP